MADDDKNIKGQTSLDLPDDVKAAMEAAAAAAKTNAPEGETDGGDETGSSLSPDEQKKVSCWRMYQDNKTYAEITAALGYNKNAILKTAQEGAELAGEVFIARAGRGSAPIPAKTNLKTAEAKGGADIGTAAMPISRESWTNIVTAGHELLATATKCDDFRLTQSEANNLGGAFFTAFKDSTFAKMGGATKYLTLIAAVVAIEVPKFSKGFSAYKKQREEAKGGAHVGDRPEAGVPVSKPLVKDGE